MVEYSDLINAIVAKMISILGKEKAISIAGVQLSEEGAFNGTATIKELETIAKNYVNVAGSVAKMLMKGAIASKVEGQSIELPEELR